MKELGYYNGKIGELSEMTVPMNDRACWFGDGVYEAGMCRNGRIFALDEHVDRLFRSAEMLEIRVPVPKEELKKRAEPGGAGKAGKKILSRGSAAQADYDNISTLAG